MKQLQSQLLLEQLRSSEAKVKKLESENERLKNELDLAVKGMRELINTDLEFRKMDLKRLQMDLERAQYHLSCFEKFNEEIDQHCYELLSRIYNSENED